MGQAPHHQLINQCYLFLQTHDKEEYRGKKAAIAAALQRDNVDEGGIDENEGDEVPEAGLLLAPYSRSQLKRWQKAPFVKPQGELPGEMGKCHRDSI